MKTCGVYNLWKLLLMCWLLSGQCWTVVDSFSWVPDEASSTLCCAIWRKNRLLMLCFCYVLWCVLYITYANNTCIVVKSVTTPLHLLNKSHRLLPVLNTVTGFCETKLCFCTFLSFVSFAWKILNQMGVALKKDGVVNEKVAFVSTHPFVHFGNIFWPPLRSHTLLKKVLPSDTEYISFF